MFGCAQLVMRKAKIVGTSDEIHARLDGLQTISGVVCRHLRVRQARRSPDGSSEPFNKGSVQFGSSHCLLKQFLGLRKRSQGHLARDLDDAFFLHVFDHRRNTEIRPHF